MERQKKQFVLLVVLLIIGLGLFAFIKLYTQKQEEKEAEEEAAATVYITRADSEDVTAFSYQLEGETLSFRYDGSNWTYDGDETVDIDEDALNTMVEAVSCLVAEEVIKEQGEPADYGLEEPANVITLTVGTENISINVGDENEILSLYYVNTSASNEIYLVDNAFPLRFDATIEELTAEEEKTEATDATETTEEIEVTEEVETTEE